MSTCEPPADELELLAAVIANVPVGVLAADAQLRCAYANERLSQLAGQRSGELCDDGFANTVDPDDRERLRDACRVAVDDHLETVEEVRLRRPDGADPHVQIRLTPLTAADGVARGVVGVVQECRAPAPAGAPGLQPTIGYVAYLE